MISEMNVTISSLKDPAKKNVKEYTEICLGREKLMAGLHLILAGKPASTECTSLAMAMQALKSDRGTYFVKT